MSIVKKCGPFMMDDAGHVVKRPGKKFRMPNLPQSMKEKYPKESSDNIFSVIGIICAIQFFDKECQAIKQHNERKERQFQSNILDIYMTMATLYYMGRVKKLGKTIQKSVRKKWRNSLAFIGKMQRAYDQYRS